MSGTESNDTAFSQTRVEIGESDKILANEMYM